MKSTILISSICVGLLITSCNTKNHEHVDSTISKKLSAEYACPMHPEVKGKEGETCPTCGMKLIKTSKDQIHMSFNSTPKVIESVKPTLLTFKPIDKSDSTKLVALENTHERMLHMITVSEDLSWFDHIHPEAGGTGSYTVTETFPAGGQYLVYADYKPMGLEPRTDRFEIHVAGESRKAVDHQPNLNAVANAYKLSIVNERPLETGSIEIPIVIEKDGQKLTREGIQNYLGAIAHIILIKKEGKDFIHIHPESTIEYPIVAHTNISKPGIYRMWVQFQTNGTVNTAAFTLDIRESSGAAQDDKKASHDHKH